MADPLHATRLACESELRAAAEAVGVELYACFTTPGKASHLTILIDKMPQGPSAEDCEHMFDQVQYICAPQNPFLAQKQIEVSSPGLDRPLLYPEHYAASINRWVDIRFHDDQNHKKRLTALIISSSEQGIRVECTDKQNLDIPYLSIIKCQWIHDYSPNNSRNK